LAAYTQGEIDQLIASSKIISEPPRREMKLIGADFRNDMKMVASNGGKGEFSTFMRMSEDFPENFSIGLTYQPNDGRPEITLLRCNGKHGSYNGAVDFNPDHPHWDFHIHKADAALMEDGLKPERKAVKTEEYASYQEALQYFVKTVNLEAKDAEKYFRVDNQQYLFTGENYDA
jgi:hypothetical protein